MKIVNLTPHPLNFIRPDGSALTVESSGLARCTTTREKIGEVEGIPINRTQFAHVSGLPQEKKGKIFVVSALVAQSVPWRKDVYIVDDTVRDEQGRIIGARALAQI